MIKNCEIIRFQMRVVSNFLFLYCFLYEVYLNYSKLLRNTLSCKRWLVIMIKLKQIW